ncbi:MAG: glycosyltransferase [Candidatus Omnitrophica bacterium]|nr:glycosyltransferase [Candidatus Omnitrophota bacterium]
MISLQTKKSSKLCKIGLVTREFFHEELRGFGGFGWMSQSIANFFNSRKNGLAVDVLINKKNCERFIQKHGNTPVIFEYARKNGFFQNSLSYLRYLTNLRSRRIKLLITIDYERGYEEILMSQPRIPAIIWLRDPRTLSDWQKVLTVELEAKHIVKKSLPELEEQIMITKRSVQNLLSQAAVSNRRILFACKGKFLIPKMKEIFALPMLEPIHLPDPILPPSEEVQKSSLPRVLFLGRLDPVKRPWIFFELAKRFSKVEFFVAGRTHFPKIMNSIIGKYRHLSNLKFLGLVQGVEKQKLLQSSWVLVNTSIHESLPLSFEEAFTCGTPVIAGNVNPDNLADRFGIFVGEHLGDGRDEHALDAFSSALEKMIDDDNFRINKGSAARKYAHETYSFENFERHLKTLWETENQIV